MFNHSDSYQLTSYVYSLLMEDNRETIKRILQKQNYLRHSYAWDINQKQLILIVDCTKDSNSVLL